MMNYYLTELEGVRLYIHREFNENIPPHERYHWTHFKILNNGERVDTTMDIDTISGNCSRFLFRSGDVIDLKKMEWNGRPFHKKMNL